MRLTSIFLAGISGATASAALAVDVRLTAEECGRPNPAFAQQPVPVRPTDITFTLSLSSLPTRASDSAAPSSSCSEHQSK